MAIIGDTVVHGSDLSDSGLHCAADAAVRLGVGAYEHTHTYSIVNTISLQ